MYTGQNIAVRPIRTASGEIAYGLYRPFRQDASILDEFETEELADRVAEIIETRFDGSYAAPARKQAKRLARQEQAKEGNT